MYLIVVVVAIVAAPTAPEEPVPQLHRLQEGVRPGMAWRPLVRAQRLWSRRRTGTDYSGTIRQRQQCCTPQQQHWSLLQDHSRSETGLYPLSHSLQSVSGEDHA